MSSYTRDALAHMNPRSLEFWAWLLIYGGALLLSLAAFVIDLDDMLGVVMMVAGVLGMGIGVVFIWRRSRLK